MVRASASEAEGHRFDPDLGILRSLIMNDLGKGIATLGIWGAVALTAYFSTGGATIGVAVCAIFGTGIVWDK